MIFAGGNAGNEDLNFKKVNEMFQWLKKLFCKQPNHLVAGNLFVLANHEDISIEWLIVREHPDDKNLVLVLPIDDFPFAGSSDVILEIGRPAIARCGVSGWVGIDILQPNFLVGFIPHKELSAVRKKLASMVRGNAFDPILQRQSLKEALGTDFDPNYEHHIESVSRAAYEMEKQ